jgi:hypothetical protein
MAFVKNYNREIEAARLNQQVPAKEQLINQAIAKNLCKMMVSTN